MSKLLVDKLDNLLGRVKIEAITGRNMLDHNKCVVMKAKIT